MIGQNIHSVYTHILMRGSRKFSRGGPASDQGGSDKILPFQNPYLEKSGEGVWTPHFDPRMMIKFMLNSHYEYVKMHVIEIQRFVLTFILLRRENIFFKQEVLI